MSPNKSLSLFSNFLDDNLLSLFEKWKTYEIVNSADFVSSIKRYIEIYCNELKKIRNPDTNSAIIDFIIKNFVYEFDSPHLRIEEICELLNVTESKFKHLFYKEIGVSFYQYCREKRMQQASEWLMSGELNVKNISAKFGYGHPKTFISEFKSYFGRSPMQYVKYYR
ncbi:helix-turn-helix transcriptional regulator [Runella slithyformis]|uniref:Transcriptional regulator, AraC family n=1 Tax=Runella slithyformis (strain ATCC 29530 / DSM 19594 / LMG 11500 / NCIMB 11436 / LSU 4) TaxID=761193 RepID=A0A7U3ZLQ1_RUNSL|nr:AraC family transcriptional regulator [Runella slithyformis]AEI49502.1 transcriptional regulator, AraC family [Runella slithyformis DSM 19594]